MHDIQRTALTRLLAVLTSLKAENRINLPDGTTYGALEIKSPDVAMPGKRSKSPYPRGERSSYVQACIGGMEVGDVVVVPLGDYPMEVLGSAVASTASRMWGPNSYVTKRGFDGKGIEILRQA